MSQNQSRQVQDYLENTVQQGQTPKSQKLLFNPTTSEVVVVGPNEKLPSPDWIPVDLVPDVCFSETTM